MVCGCEQVKTSYCLLFPFFWLRSHLLDASKGLELFQKSSCTRTYLASLSSWQHQYKSVTGRHKKELSKSQETIKKARGKKKPPDQATKFTSPVDLVPSNPFVTKSKKNNTKTPSSYLTFTIGCHLHSEIGKKCFVFTSSHRVIVIKC